ncbi:MAG: mechanosensitive ion channel family protein [Chitinophagaceae bacterium]
MLRWLQQVYYGNTTLDYLLLLTGLLLIGLLLHLLKSFVITYLKKFTAKTTNELDDVLVSAIDKFIVPLGYLTINYLLINRLHMPAALDKTIDTLILIVWVYYAVRIVNHSLHYSLVLYMRHKGESEQRITQVTSMLLIIKGIVWAIGFLLFISNLGVNVGAALTGLGIGGIAIALATQNIFADLFSYLVIFFDKPFEVGDAITINGNTGTVEKIGIKTSHVRSVDGQQLVIPNAEMVKSTIQNFKRLERRRVVFTVGVTYQTPHETLQQIPKLIEAIIVQQPHATFDRCHLRSLADSSINFETVYFIEAPDFKLMVETQHSVYLAIIEIFNKNNIQFAYPTRTIELKQVGKAE